MAATFERRCKRAVLFLALLTLWSSQGSEALWSQSQPTGSVMLPDGNGSDERGMKPGDLVRLSSWREQDLTGDFMVDQSGSVILPLLGPMRVLGVGLTDLRDELLDRYKALLLEPVVDVTLLRRVRILGEVKTPGVYHVDPTMTLGDVVALAGGTTPDGKLADTRIIRRSEVVRADLEANVPVMEILQSGDQIIVPRHGWLARNHLFLIASTITAVTMYFVRY